ncbi:hypothetical protein HRR83_004010 [Exophiala dermatitidis]|uniref:Methyltransferase domain-containing protein n=2 Tax=Exophiala dermatitidis TaxID=5970 RepID=H6BRZ2_EXODN|nr:uncharacterized protein HMPREF1120_02983 [Exophiala dermatitidis NIH/UT8656]KAJ4507432.1 hypothetical protein HRR73_007653 [Exophiala dermatitidis]EHY54820.1 hypothetical protein HMPREF1120_02983 [Exophiala dermatitidis NIH/UT8656]KAJ4521689.1 hypothetical protein HRR74_003514 [Exophiala dermatitidis]KAJ4531737.1 hypothetical protein HRR77_009146 [Exophiala dermatitidis]KAJ4545111.1 hypothetical protein HRR76_003140 [Exophiala dermatitidis]
MNICTSRRNREICTLESLRHQVTKMTDIAARNKEKFDKDASTHLSDWAELIQAIINELVARRHWMSSKWVDSESSAAGCRDIRLLDYACGSGTVSKALLPFITQAVGLDISTGMVSEYNKWAQSTGLDSDKVWAYEYDMLAGGESKPLPQQKLSDFDIVVVSMALHHVSDPTKLMQRLAKCLRPGGTCVILDRVPDSTSSRTDVTLSTSQAEMLKTVNQHGFSEGEMRRLYQDAGLGHKFDYVVIPHPFKAQVFGQELSITGFIARGELV